MRSGSSSQSVRLLRKLVRERARHLAGVAQLDDVPSHETAQVVGIDATREIMPGGDRAERACVVVEADRVVDTSRLRGSLTEPHHALNGVVKPPRRAEAQRRIVAGQRSQL